MHAVDYIEKVTGIVHIVLTDEHGEIKETRVANTVVTAGKNVLADRMKVAPSKQAMSHMAVGSGTTAVTLADTALNVEVARVGLGSTVVAGAVITYTATFNPGVGSGTLSEAGIFNDPTIGDMLARTSFGVITKGALDTLTVTWSVTIN
jgi:hypothetical protein